jgi:hypothetical protein
LEIKCGLNRSLSQQQVFGFGTVRIWKKLISVFNLAGTEISRMTAFVATGAVFIMRQLDE